MRRRDFIKLVSGTLVLSAGLARGQSYPSRPVRLVVGFPPGGTTDIVARVLGQWLSERLSAPFVIENRPGAGTNVATETVVRAPADGHTLLVVTPANAINTSFYDKLDFDFERDITPVASLIRSPYVLHLNSGHHLEHLSRKVTGCPSSKRSDVNFAGIGFGIGDEFRNRFGRKTGKNLQHG